MTRRWIAFAATVFLAVAANVMVSAQASGARSIWDGVYTDAQAARGALAFNQSCANCHAVGEDGTRPVVGEKFWQNFAQKSVVDLVNFLRTSMPNGSPGTLPQSTYNDLAAYILKANGFPAGVTDVAPETGAGVQIIPKDGPGELPSNTLVRVVGCLAKSGGDWVLTSATTPERTDKSGVAAEDATRQLGSRTMALKFVLTRLDAFSGHRMSVSGLLIGAGGKDGINVTGISSVAPTCP